MFLFSSSKVMKYILTWQLLSVSQHLTSYCLCVSLATVPQTLQFAWFTKSLTGPFVLHFDCCCCIMWCQERRCKAKSSARGETSQSFHINSPQGSHGVDIWTLANRQTLSSAVPCLSALNNPGSSL